MKGGVDEKMTDEKMEVEEGGVVEEESGGEVGVAVHKVLPPTRNASIV